MPYCDTAEPFGRLEDIERRVVAAVLGQRVIVPAEFAEISENNGR